MNCKVCKQPFSLTKQNKFPRVLTACGHTFCHDCIQNTIESNNIISCFQCSMINQKSNKNFPINQTLKNIVQNYQKQEFCGIHGKKLQAYCQKDNQLLCLNCVLTTHKSHKVSSISEKVEKDKEILKNSFNKIQKNKKQYEIKLSECEKNIDQMIVHYNDYLLEISLMYKKIVNQIKQQEQEAFQKSKATFQKEIAKIKQIQQQLKQKIQFCGSLNSVYNLLMEMDDIVYLNQDNKRIFIVQNSNFKQFKIQTPKIQLNKISLLQNITFFLEQVISLEKINKSKSKKKQSYQIKQSIGIGGSPSFSKKNSIRQPQILQVNLSEQYQKHQILKNKSKIQLGKNSINQKQKKQNKSSKEAKFITSRRSNQSKQFTISVFSEQQFFESKDSFSLQNANFASLTPLSIKSFMNSSQQTIFKDNFSLKDSKAEFTIMEEQSYVYHFGGLNNNSIEKTSLYIEQTDSLMTSKKLERSVLNRSKCQAVIFKKYSETKCLIIGGKNQQGERLSSILSFDVQKNMIQETQFKLSQPKSGFGAVVKNDKLFLVGGSSVSSLNTLEQYQINSLKGNKLNQRKLASMINSRDQLGFTIGLDGYLYVAGGINNSNSILNSCEKYSFQKNKWSSIASMKISRRSFTLIALPNGIFAIGGHDGKNPLNSVEMFQYDSNSWRQVCNLETARFTHTSIITKNFQNIIVFGGYKEEPLKSVQIYNVLQNKWKYGTNLQQNRFLHCSLLINQRHNFANF